MERDNLPNKQTLRNLKRDFQTNDLKLGMYFSKNFLIIGKVNKEDQAVTRHSIYASHLLGSFLS